MPFDRLPAVAGDVESAADPSPEDLLLRLLPALLLRLPLLNSPTTIAGHWGLYVDGQAWEG